MTNYVYSTMSSDVCYAMYEPKSHDKALNIIRERILIKGGANVALGKHLVTSLGIATAVTDEQLEMLKRDRVFQKHLEGKFLRIESSNKPVEKVVKDMAAKDASAPRTPGDYKDAGENDVKPVLNKK